MSTQPHPSSTPPPNAAFAATRWSIVLAAADPARRSHSRRALEQLAQSYWYPLYAYIRRQGRNPHEAEDLTQSFFARLIEKDYLADVDRAKGKFRSFLLASLNHFLANEWNKDHALKRGGGVQHIPLDAASAESRYALEPADTTTPQRLFERRWALAVLDQVLLRLRQDFASRGKETLFDALKTTLTDPPAAPTYGQLAAQLHMTESAVRTASHRLRRRYRELLRAEIAETVATPDLIDEEIRFLLHCL